MKMLVTGGSRGIGASIAAELMRAGHEVAITSRDESAAAKAASAIAAEVGTAPLHLTLDVRHVAEIESAVTRAAEQLGGLDGVVNNAGIALSGWALNVTEAEWDAVADTNLKGAFFVSRAAAVIMRAAGSGGVIVNLASTGAFVGASGVAAYCASKGGLTALTRALAVEWATFGIRVVAVAPGVVETDLNREVFADEGRRSRQLDRVPTGRFVTAQEVGLAVCYLVSAGAVSITGSTLVLDGGELAG